ncbi:MAG: hypothetical protein MSH10_04100 [Pygmaiobacter massiliensis]|nr:hypothetical protein [Pygmaiobacter massiliensis]
MAWYFLFYSIARQEYLAVALSRAQIFKIFAFAIKKDQSFDWSFLVQRGRKGRGDLLFKAALAAALLLSLFSLTAAA